MLQDSSDSLKNDLKSCKENVYCIPCAFYVTIIFIHQQMHTVIYVEGKKLH